LCPFAISSTYPKGKVFPNHTHVALSSSLTIFILFFSFDSSGLPGKNSP